MAYQKRHCIIVRLSQREQYLDPNMILTQNIAKLDQIKLNSDNQIISNKNLITYFHLQNYLQIYCSLLIYK